MNVEPRIRIDPRIGARVRKLAAHVGLETPLLHAYERLLDPAAQRDRIDNEHMRMLLAFCLREDSNCVDVGAHAGALLREMVRCAPSGHHVAYEPLPEYADLLRTQFPGVDVRNAAVSNVAGEDHFFRVRDFPALSRLKPNSGTFSGAVDTITIRTETLDEGLPPDYIPDLIKIDVEGGERQVIEGALQIISRHQPIVCFEHGSPAEDRDNTSSAQIYDLLNRQAGLRVFDIDGNGPLSEQEFIARYHRPIWNYVAHR